MSFFQAIKLALDTIRVQKLKSFFSVIGVTIGVTFLIAVVSIVGGMSRYMEDDLVGKIIAVNSFSLRTRPDFEVGDATAAQRAEWRRRPRILRTDVDPVAQSLPPTAHWAVESSSSLTIETPYASPRRTQISTVSDGWFAIKKMGATQGRLINPQEYNSGTPVVVVGQDVADHFYPNLNPIGRELKIQGIPYTVIGVADKQGTVFGQSLDKFVIAPERSPLNRWVNPHGVIDAMIIQGDDDASMREAMEEARITMRSRRHLHPAQPDNFELETSENALAFWDKVKGYLVIAGVALPAVGLVVGAIVIMNIMLVAVSERTAEIGVRKALGARRRDILAQFLVESATLATMGSAIGILAGIGIAALIAAVSPLPTHVAPWSVAVAIVLGAGVGIVAGVYPASRASRLDPITALRAE
jgi:putative ABC transport system permease protein